MGRAAILLRKLGLLLLMALTAVALAAWLLDTGPGRRLVADAIRSLPFENGLRIEIGRIEGSIYGKVVLHDVSLKDPKGEFLYSPEVRANWRPLAWLSNHLDIRKASAGRVILRRLPRFRLTPPSDAPLLPDFDIDIGRLEIDRFIAEPPVAGSRQVLSLFGSAHIADRRAQLRVTGRTIAGQERGGGDRIAVLVDAVPERNRLTLDVTLDAPRDGVIAAMAGLSQPMALRLRGKGDWRKWDGRLVSTLGDKELARLALGARDGRFTLRGPARLGLLVSGAPGRLLGSVTTLDVTAVPQSRRIAIEGTAFSDAARLEARGLADLGENRFEAMRLALSVAQPAALARNLAASGLRAELVLDGAFAEPEARYAVTAQSLAFDGTGLQQFAARGLARVEGGNLVVPLDANAARVTGIDALAGGPLDAVRLTGKLTFAGNRILSDDLRILSRRLDAKGVLLADTRSGAWKGSLTGRLDDYRIDGVGIFTLDADTTIRGEKGGPAIAGKLRLRSRAISDETVRELLGGEAVASGDVSYGPDGVVRLANIRMQAPAMRVTSGNGTLSRDGGIMLAASGVTRAYGSVAVVVTGTLADPRASIVARSPGFGIGLADVEVRFSRAGKGYRLILTGQTDFGPLSADVTLATGAAGLLRIDKGDLAGIGFAGDLRRTSAGPWQGRLTADGQGISGIVRLAAQGRYQEVLLNLRARDTVLPGRARLGIGLGRVDARIVLYETPHVVADAQLADVRMRDLELTAARVLVDYRGGRGKASALVEGAGGVPFRLAANATLEPGMWRAALNGKLRGVDIRTVGPARIVPRPDGYELLPARLDFGQGSMRISGHYGDAMTLRARLDAMDMNLLNAFMPGLGAAGKATGSIDYVQTSPSAAPRADVRLAIRDFSRASISSVSQPLDVNLAGSMQGDGGEARAVFRRQGNVVGRLVATLRPMPAGPGNWRERLMATPLGGGIRYNGPVETLLSLAGQADQGLSGGIGLAADFGCRLGNPCLNGVLRGANMTYENAQYGTRFTGIAVSGRLEGNRLLVDQLTANGGNGRLSAKGYIGLAADDGYPMDLAISLDNARLARSEALTARASGDLRLTKRAGENALLAGELTLPETRFKVIRENAAQVPVLSGVRFKPQRGPRRVSGEELASPGPGLLGQLRLAITLRAPERLYVSGMGLDSEWDADFAASGTGAAPRLTGEVRLLRGTIGLAGRSFEMTEGHVNFTGGPTLDPQLRIVASEQVDELAVRVNIGGRATSPEISFTSVPGLPQEEVLSRLLFGSSAANLSALQAVQLAASVNTLRASGGGINPLGKLRSVAGIDRLRVIGPDETGSHGTAVAAGQYLTDDIYFELITDTRGFTATQLEVSLTPWLSLLSRSVGTGVSSVNVKVRKDY